MDLEDDGAISEMRARAIVEPEARAVYGDLSAYTVSARWSHGRWFVDYEPTDPDVIGGGPHFELDGRTGEVLGRRYEQ